MNTEIQTNASSGLERRSRKRSRGPVILFVFLWMLLIASGVTGAVWYTEQTTEAMKAEIERQTAAQIDLMKQDYERQIKKVEESFAAEMTVLGSKVDALNELLTFAQDNANDKTDNSNKLYTQINEVKKKLNELQKSLDVLK
ncbi:hypothetical protein AB6A23_03095 [Paenibacillus tarimensis]